MIVVREHADEFDLIKIKLISILCKDDSKYYIAVYIVTSLSSVTIYFSIPDYL